nr:hypothetical protein ctg_00003 [Ostreid herpesvirus 1]WHP53370.1 hypothetical protein ctg_00135 [Ostreid herpesvirus 1]
MCKPDISVYTKNHLITSHQWIYANFVYSKNNHPIRLFETDLSFRILSWGRCSVLGSMGLDD